MGVFDDAGIPITPVEDAESTVEDVNTPTPEPAPTPDTTKTVDTEESLPAYDDPDLLAAHATVESSGNAKAIGPRTKYGRAKGLYQMLDNTFSQYGPAGADPYDESANTAARNNYMGKLMGRFNNDIKLALTAYHAGEGNLNKWLKQYKASTWEELKPHLRTKAPNSYAYADKVLSAYNKLKGTKEYPVEDTTEEPGGSSEEVDEVEEEEEESADSVPIRPPEEVVPLAKDLVTEKPPEPKLPAPPGSELKEAKDVEMYRRGYPERPRRLSKLDLLRKRIADYDQAREDVYSGTGTSPVYSPQPESTREEFANTMYPIMADPYFGRLSTQEQMSALSKVYKSKNWSSETGELVKQLADDIYSGAAPDEDLDVSGLVSSLVGPPPQLNADKETVLDNLGKWQSDVYTSLRTSGMSPALLGSKLEKYFKQVVDSESEAADVRASSGVGKVANYAGNFTRDIVKGGVRTFSDTAAAAARYATASVASPETAAAVGDFVASAPDILQSPATNYLFETDENGRLRFDPVTNRPIPKISSSIAQGIGQIASFIYGGTVLKGLTAPLIAKSAMGGMGTLMSMEAGYKESEAAGGTAEQNLVTGLLSAPGGAFQGFVGYSVAAKAPPALFGLNALNRAKVLAPWLLKGAIPESLGMNAQQYLQSKAVETVTGKEAVTAEKQTAATVMGFFGAVAGKGLEARGAWKIANIKEGLDARGQAALDKLVSKYAAGHKEVPLTKEEEVALSNAMQRFQSSNAYAVTVDKNVSDKINPDLLKPMHIEKVQEADQSLLVKRYTHDPVVPTDNIKELDTAIAKETEYLAARNPNVEESIAKKQTLQGKLRAKIAAIANKLANTEKYIAEGEEAFTKAVDTNFKAQQRKLKKQRRQKIATYAKQMQRLTAERQVLQKEFDAAKELKESPDSKVTVEGKQLAHEYMVEAGEKLAAFDSAAEAKYEGWKEISSLTEQIDGLTKHIAEATGDTPYLNNISLADKNLKLLLEHKSNLIKEKLAAETKSAEIAQDLVGEEANLEQSRLSHEESKQTRDTLLQKREKLAAENKLAQSDRSAKITAETIASAKMQQAAETRAKERNAKTSSSRKEMLAAIGLPDADAALHFSDGVNISGYKLIPIGFKWAIVSPRKTVIGKGFDSAFAAIERVREITNVAAPKPKVTTGGKVGLQTKGTAGTGTRIQDIELADTTDTETKVGRKLEPDKEASVFLRKSVPNRPLTSNYTKDIDLADTYAKIVPLNKVFTAVQKLIKAVGSDIRIFTGGLMPKGYIGYLEKIKNFIKVGRHDDVLTAMHEAMHVIDKELIGKWSETGDADYSGLSKQAASSFEDMAETFYKGDLVNTEQKIKEGIALFFQHYFSGQPVRRELLTWLHSDFAGDHPAIYKQIEALKDIAHQYFGQTSENIILSRVAKAVSFRKKVLDTLTITNAIEKFINREAPLGEAKPHDPTKVATKYAELGLEFTKDANYLRGNGIGDSLTSGQVTDFFANEYPLTKNLNDTFKVVKKKHGKLVSYLIAKSAIARYNKGIEPGIPKDTAEKVINDVEANHTDIRDAVEKYYTEWLPAVYRVIEQTGPQGKWYIDTMKKYNLETTGAEHGYWVPFQREGHSYVNSMKASKGSTLPPFDPLMTIEGSVRHMINSAVRQATVYDAATFAGSSTPTHVGTLIREVTGGERIGLFKEFKQRVTNAFGDSDVSNATKENMTGFLFPEFEGISGKGFKVHVVMDGNKARFFEFDPRITKALDDSLPEFFNSPFYKAVFRWPAAAFRPMATTLKLAFQIRNMCIDLPTAWEFLQSEGAAGGAKDLWDLVKLYSYSMAEQVSYGLGYKQHGWYAKVRRAGLAHASMFGTEHELVRTTKGTKATSAISMAGATLNKIIDIMSAPENATRLAALRIFMKKRFGITDPNQEWGALEMAEAAWFYKNVTTNYAKQGQYARNLNMHMPFLTARIATLSRLPMVAARSPKKIGALAAVSLLTGVLHALAHEDEDWYKETAPQQKMDSIMFDWDVGGVKKVFFIPLSTPMKVPWALGQALGNAIMKDKSMRPKTLDLVRAYFGTMSPVNHPADFLGVLGREAAAQMMNKDFYFNRSIVPPSLMYTDARDRVNQYTTSLAKSQAEFTGLPPINVDHAIRNTLPAVADALSFFDKATGRRKSKEDSSYNFIVTALSRAGSAQGILDNSKAEFMRHLLDYKANKGQESPEEAKVRKNLERLNEHISDSGTLLQAALTQKDRDTINKTIREALRRGVAIAKGQDQSTVAPSPIHARAEAIRKQRKEELRTDLATGRQIPKKRESLMDRSD